LNDPSAKSGGKTRIDEDESEAEMNGGQRIEDWLVREK